jgi:hypothetical protein
MRAGGGIIKNKIKKKYLQFKNEVAELNWTTKTTAILVMIGRKMLGAIISTLVWAENTRQRIIA